MAIEIVDFPIKNGDFPYSYVIIGMLLQCGAPIYDSVQLVNKLAPISMVKVELLRWAMELGKTS